MHTHTTERSRAGRINVYNRQGHYERALENHHKSLDIKIRVVGHDHHTDVAGSYSNIGGVYRKLDVSSPSRTDSTRLTRGVRSPPQRLAARRTSSPPSPPSPPKSASRNSSAHTGLRSRPCVSDMQARALNSSFSSIYISQRAQENTGKDKKDNTKDRKFEQSTNTAPPPIPPGATEHQRQQKHAKTQARGMQTLYTDTLYCDTIQSYRDTLQTTSYSKRTRSIVRHTLDRDTLQIFYSKRTHSIVREQLQHPRLPRGFKKF